MPTPSRPVPYRRKRIEHSGESPEAIAERRLRRLSEVVGSACVRWLATRGIKCESWNLEHARRLADHQREE
ncbi:MAG: hypothetical protein NTW21_37570 [Verrucomicrobia bacterium]|nr:hypothetical protein [Verrucomicrobiota bacterium]